MKIAMITPSYYPFVRGNAVTVRRIAKNLQAGGCEVQVSSLDTVTAEDTLKEVLRFAPDIIHAFHGFFGGRIARLIARTLRLPYLITLTGTDVYEALQDSRRDETLSALQDASAVVAFHQSIESRLLENLPIMAGKTSIIPQGVEVPGMQYYHHDEFRPAAGEPVILLPAGLRPVKNVTFPLPLLEKLFHRGKSMYFVLIGPVLHRGYAAEALAEYERFPFAHYYGEVGHNAIGWFYKHADIVLNTSSFEGGMANTVLEAMVSGKAVLASNIEGNRSVVEDEVNGMLYQGETQFLEKLERLLTDAKLRQKLGDHARHFVREYFVPEKEASAYEDLYGKILGSSNVSSNQRQQ